MVQAENGDIDLNTWIEENAVNECIEFAKVLEANLLPI